MPSLGRFHVVNLGCKVNRAESDTIAATLMAAGAERTELSDADVVVVNTCTVTAEADAKTRKAVRRAVRANPRTVIVTGCLAALDPEGLTALGDNVIVEPSKPKAAELALEACQVDGPFDAPDTIGIRAGEGFKARMDLKIQDGCDNRCTYCIVWKARGAATSLPWRAVVEQVAHASSHGVREVVLTGINLGAYDDGGVRLPELMARVLDETDVGRIRVSSIEPPHVDGDLAAVLAAHPGRLCAHFHIPLQSGCDRTLAAMGRTYDTAAFARGVGELRAACPSVAITTDIIVGFPGETDEDHALSLAFCKQMAFTRMHVFRYSRRPGTVADAMESQVADEVKAMRARELRELAAEMAEADARNRIGSEELVLATTPFGGVGDSYHEVRTEVELQVGELALLRYVSVDHAGRLAAEPV
ncbi:MAG: MiaB/RimO family radical SAM methylthiotransferase [Coriobacteriales bacterium]|jgi:threonylcarbamoyladenosine tRNA methylthiotransferase MtaB